MASRVLPIMILVLLAASVAAQPDDSMDTDSPDSVGVASADSADAELEEDLEEEDIEDEESEGGIRARRERRRARREEDAEAADSLLAEGGDSWFWDTHPDFNMKINKQKDVTNWDTKITLRRRVNSKINFNLSATLQTRENSTLNRSDSNDGTSANLKYSLSDEVNFGLKYNSHVSAFRYDLDRADPDERKRKQDVTVSAELSKQILPGVDIRLKTNAGSTQNAYTSVSNEGSRQDISASISYSPSEDLRTSVNYTAKRMLLDSKVDSSGSSVFTSKDRTFSQDISMSAAYNLISGVKVDMGASHSDNRKQHPDPKRKEQETEHRTSSRASVKTVFDLVERLTWELSVAFSESKSLFVLQNNRDNASTASSIDGSAKILPWRGATINVGGNREVKRSDYQTPESGRDLHKSLSLKLTQDLGSKTDLSLTALSDMVSIFYDDKVNNKNDRDRLNNRVSMDLSYDPLEKISMNLGGEFSGEKSVYIDASKSGGNRNTQRYRLSGSYTLKTFRRTTVRQDYDISAVYTFYDYDDQFGQSRNTLVRNSNLRTRISVPLSRDLKFGVGHQYKFQDQGGYTEREGAHLYARSAERETHIMSIDCKYTFLKYVNINVKQSYQIQRNWKYFEGEKRLEYEIPSSDISGRIDFTYNIGAGTKVSLSVEQNRREGSRVGKAFRNYRNIEFEASHVF